MRFFLTLAYHGGAFCGWQRQPNGTSVQAVLEEALTVLLRHPVEVTGCGRTDAGVHARYYVAHFDTEQPLPEKWQYRLNSLLPSGVAVYDCIPVADTAHARFDAFERAYEYHIALRKTPFEDGLVWLYPQARHMELEKAQAAANLLLQYDAFFPFCKTHSGVDHYRCELKAAHWEWKPEDHKLIFHVAANRFLRGMVRLMVGACVQVGLGQLELADIKTAMDAQKSLRKSWSVPPDGLYLTQVRYPD